MHTTTLLNTLWEFTTGIEDEKDSFIQRALKMFKTFKIRSLKTPRFDVPAKKTAYKHFCKDMRETNEELKDVPVSKASAIILKEWKKVKANNKKMKKYRDLYEVEKHRHEEALQRYQEDHMDQMEIINLRKRCNKTGAKTETKRGAKAGSKTGAKAASKAPRSGYHLFLKQQLEKMTGEDRKNFHNIISGRWKKIKEGPVKLFTYNNRARQRGMKQRNLLNQEMIFQ